MKKVFKYVMLDILRNKIVLAYTLLLLVLSLSIFQLETDSTKGILSILHVVLIIVPLVSAVFSTIYIYNSAEFIELLVSQPIKRESIWLSIVLGLASSLIMAFLIGCGIPILLMGNTEVSLLVAGMGVLLTLIFVCISALAAVYTRDKAKGIGVAILLWLFFTLLYDGLIMFLLFQFMDYPIEKTLAGISLLNPIDLARILILLKLDVSALMGVTSAIFKEFFGSITGRAITLIALLIWAIAPLVLSVRKFRVKNL